MRRVPRNECRRSGGTGLKKKKKRRWFVRRRRRRRLPSPLPPTAAGITVALQRARAAGLRHRMQVWRTGPARACPHNQSDRRAWRGPMTTVHRGVRADSSPPQSRQPHRSCRSSGFVVPVLYTRCHGVPSVWVVSNDNNDNNIILYYRQNVT